MTTARLIAQKQTSRSFGKFLISPFILGEVALRVLLLSLWYLCSRLNPLTLIYSQPAQWQDFSYPHQFHPWIPTVFLTPLIVLIYALISCMMLPLLYWQLSFPFWTLMLEAIFLGLPASLAFLGSAVLTNIIKLFVGRPRPDFLNRCLPSYFSNTTSPTFPLSVLHETVPTCEESSLFSPAVIADGRKSFPSGHASYVASVSIVTGLYLYHICSKISRQKPTNAFVSFLTCPGVYSSLTLAWIILPPFFTAATRVLDRRHHPTDVIAGLILGYAVGFTAFTVYFRHPDQYDAVKLDARTAPWAQRLTVVPPSMNFAANYEEESITLTN